MRVSLNTIKQFTTVDLPVDELVTKINKQLGGVEQVIDLADKYKDALIVRVVKCEKHPDADKLSVCKIAIGDNSLYSKFVIPDSANLVEVVCGASNVHADMWAIWLPPGSTVPASYDDKDPFVLDVRELRGVKSHGMLAAADELGIGTDHAGIIELTDDDLSPFGSVKKLEAGLSFAKTFGLDDTIIDIENKMFTHRPDLFGQLGVAREIAGIQGIQFASPEWYAGKKEEGRKKNKEDLELTVSNEASDVVPRFMAVAVRDVTVKKSPMWLQTSLIALGGKPINNIVDVTNYVMLLTAQPTHAYDYDKLRGKYLGTRLAKKGEKIRLLNDKTYELDESDIVIVDGEGPVGLAGIMGGGDSEVSDTTKNIVIEVANFDMYAVRRSSMRHGLFTDALTRFNKGQSPLQNPAVLAVTMASVIDVAGGEQASDIYDEHAINLNTAIETNELHPPLTIKPDFIRDRLGLDMSKYDMVQLIGNVEFPLCEDCGWNPEDKADNDDDLHVNIPFWRTDIVDPEDIVEEIGRLYGFDKLPRELPRRTITPPAKNPSIEIKRLVRESLSRNGANEVLTYSFVHEKTMQRAEQDISQAFRLSNALSPDLQYYRLSVLPSLLDRVNANIKSGHDEFTLYEVGKGHNKKYHADDDEGLPSEIEFVDGVYASKKSRDGAAYYHIRRLIDQLARDLGFSLKFEPIKEPLDFPITAPFDQSRSAMVMSRNGEFIGMIGELKQSVLRSFKMPQYTAAFSLDLKGLLDAHSAATNSYKPLSRYPRVTQDISLRVGNDVLYEQVVDSAKHVIETSDIGAIDYALSPLSIYRADADSDHKTITLRLAIASYERTLTDKDVTTLMDAIADQAHKDFSAERV